MHNLFIQDDIRDARMEDYRASRFEAAMMQAGMMAARYNFPMLDRTTWLTVVWSWTH